MKTLSLTILIAFAGLAGFAQIAKPVIQFDDEPRTHNVHIASDGKYLYTVNGGRADMGQINKYTLEGRLVDSYDILLDMRSLMYNGGDKHFYVCTYERNIYKITDMEKGKHELVLSGLYENEQANLAISPDGKYLYYFSSGKLTIYKFPSGTVYKTFDGLDCGSKFSTGSSCVAVDGKYFYTWNADYKMIFAYDKKGKKVKTLEIEKGDYGFSLSFANGLIFVSTDGDYDTGTWYGYNFWAK
jgi:DNA-binding beta-propeller fold protein YncE